MSASTRARRPRFRQMFWYSSVKHSSLLSSKRITTDLVAQTTAIHHHSSIHSRIRLLSLINQILRSATYRFKPLLAFPPVSSITFISFSFPPILQILNHVRALKKQKNPSLKKLNQSQPQQFITMGSDFRIAAPSGSHATLLNVQRS